MKLTKRIFTGLTAALCAITILPVGFGTSGLFTDSTLTASAEEWEWKSTWEEAIFHKLSDLPFGAFTDGNGAYVYGSRTHQEQYTLGSFGSVTSWGNTITLTENTDNNTYVCDNLRVLNGTLRVTFNGSPMDGGTITLIEFNKDNVTYTYRPISVFDWDVHIGNTGLSESEQNSISYDDTVVYNIKPETYASANGTLTPLAAASGSVATHKIGMYDKSGRYFTVAPAVFSNDVVYVPFSGAKTGDNERISAIVTDNQNNVLAYARLAVPTSEYGTIAVRLPSGFSTSFNSLYLFNEEYKAGTDSVLTSNLQKVEFSSSVYGGPTSESGVLRNINITSEHYTNGGNTKSANVDLRVRTIEVTSTSQAGAIDSTKNDSSYHIWNVTVNADVLYWDLVKNVDTKNYQTLTWDAEHHTYTTGTGGKQSETVSYTVDPNDNATKTLSITNDSNFPIRRSVSILENDERFSVTETNATIAIGGSATSSVTIDPTKFSNFNEYNYTSVGTAAISLFADGNTQSYTGS